MVGADHHHIMGPLWATGTAPSFPGGRWGHTRALSRGGPWPDSGSQRLDCGYVEPREAEGVTAKGQAGLRGGSGGRSGQALGMLEQPR